MRHHLFDGARRPLGCSSRGRPAMDRAELIQIWLPHQSRFGSRDRHARQSEPALFILTDKAAYPRCHGRSKGRRDIVQSNGEHGPGWWFGSRTFWVLQIQCFQSDRSIGIDQPRHGSEATRWFLTESEAIDLLLAVYAHGELEGSRSPAGRSVSMTALLHRFLPAINGQTTRLRSLVCVRARSSMKSLSIHRAAPEDYWGWFNGDSWYDTAREGGDGVLAVCPQHRVRQSEVYLVVDRAAAVKVHAANDREAFADQICGGGSALCRLERVVSVVESRYCGRD